ncbi:unnamed protein product, partial [Lymnaea stagnalis]
WTAWGQCSLSCGNGTQARTRACDGPYHGGVNCTGPTVDAKRCNTQSCAG